MVKNFILSYFAIILACSVGVSFVCCPNHLLVMMDSEESYAVNDHLLQKKNQEIVIQVSFGFKF